MLKFFGITVCTDTNPGTWIVLVVLLSILEEDKKVSNFKSVLKTFLPYFSLSPWPSIYVIIKYLADIMKQHKQVKTTFCFIYLLFSKSAVLYTLYTALTQ